MFGGGGNDLLLGDLGNNILNGGDRFVLRVGGTALIQDFQPGQDSIGLPQGVSFNQLTLEPSRISLNGVVLATFANSVALSGVDFFS